MRNTGSSLAGAGGGLGLGDLLLLISTPAPHLTQRHLHTPCRPLTSHWIQLPVSHGTFTLIESLGSALLPPHHAQG